MRSRTYFTFAECLVRQLLSLSDRPPVVPDW